MRENERSAGAGVLAQGRKERVELGHRGGAGVDGVDDLGVVDASEVDPGDAEIAVSDPAE
jgi:hypothetical protein